MSGSKKTIGIIAVLVTIVAVGAYFVGRPMMEDKQREEILAFLEKNELVAESVVSDSFGTGTTITKLSGSFDYLGMGTGTFTVDKLTVGGINLGARLTKGVSALVDDCKAEGVTVTITMPLPGDEGAGEMRQVVTADEAVLRNVRGDLNALESIDTKGLSVEAFPEELAEVIAGFSVGEVNLKNYRSKVDSLEGVFGAMGGVETVIGNYLLKDSSLVGCGTMLLEDVSINAMGSSVFKLERLGAAGMRVPNMLTLIGKLQKVEQTAYGDEEAARAALEQMFADFEKTPLEVKGLYAEKGQFKFMLPEALTFDKIGLSCFVDPNKAAITVDVDHLVVPKALYALGSPSGQVLAQVYGKPLDLTYASDLELSRQGGNGTIQYRNIALSEANLFSISGSAELPFTSKHERLVDLMEEGGDVFLKTAAVTLEDKGAVTLAFRVQEVLMGLESEQASGELLRQAAIANVRQLGATLPTPGAQKLADGMISLLQAPGTLAVKVTPEEPVALESADFMKMMPEVTYTPAK